MHVALKKKLEKISRKKILMIENKNGYQFGKFFLLALTRIKLVFLFSDTEASEKLSAVISNARMCNDVSKMSPLHQTYCLEGFHSVVIQFAPKSKCFSYEGMLGRQVLLDFVVYTGFCLLITLLMTYRI